MLGAGCYTLRPVDSVVPDGGVQVAFDINDAGRNALGPIMGPGIEQIEGRVVRKDTDEYVVAVTSVALFRGGKQTWKGEEIRLKPEHISRTYERTFSRTRTFALTAVGVGAFGWLVTRPLFGAGDEPDKTPTDTAQTRRALP
jgi:hypothetical protein